jgi:general secretion pathway protein M
MTLRERFEKLEPRERRLLAILGSILGAFVFLLGPIGVYGVVTGKRTENQDLRDLIDKIYDARTQIAERKAKKDALLPATRRPRRRSPASSRRRRRRTASAPPSRRTAPRSPTASATPSAPPW